VPDKSFREVKECLEEMGPGHLAVRCKEVGVCRVTGQGPVPAATVSAQLAEKKRPTGRGYRVPK
jgi:hypothetical protein